VNLFVEKNRAVANQFVDNACHSIVATDVKASVNNNGEFIDADGYEFDVFSDRLV